MNRSAYATLAAFVLAASPSPAQDIAPGPSPDDARPVLELTLDEAVRRTLENNVDIAVERFNPESSALDVDELRGFYEPVLTSLITQNSAARPGSNAFSGAQSVDSDVLNYAFGALQYVPFAALPSETGAPLLATHEIDEQRLPRRDLDG